MLELKELYKIALEFLNLTITSAIALTAVSIENLNKN